MMFIIGFDITMIGLPTTRLYSPLERITGFSFGYSMAMGVIGGFTPNISNAIKASCAAGEACLRALHCNTAWAGGGALMARGAQARDRED
jgi:hypothetical protein